MKPDPQLPKKLFYLFEWKPFKDDEIENSFCFLRSFILKLTETALVPLKNGTRGFQYSILFVRFTCFSSDNHRNIEHFQYFNFEANFLKNETFFSEN